MPTRIHCIHRIVLTVEIRLLVQIGVTRGERPIADLAIILKLYRRLPRAVSMSLPLEFSGVETYDCERQDKENQLFEGCNSHAPSSLVVPFNPQWAKRAGWSILPGPTHFAVV